MQRDPLLRRHPGVDVATKHEIYQLVGRLAREGRAILFYSSDAEELAHLAHRVIVMREGRVAAELEPPMTAEEIVSSAVRDTHAASPPLPATDERRRAPARRARRAEFWPHPLLVVLAAAVVIYCAIFYARLHALPGGFELTSTVNNTMPLVLAGLGQSLSS